MSDTLPWIWKNKGQDLRFRDVIFAEAWCFMSNSCSLREDCNMTAQSTHLKDIGQVSLFP
jgi:hypothetical protein